MSAMLNKWIMLSVIISIISLPSYAQELTRTKKSYHLQADEVYQVDLRMDAAKFRLGSSGDPNKIVVTLRYTRDEFAPKIDFEEDRNRFRFAFDKRGWGVDGGDEVAYVRVDLPTDIKMHLEAHIKAGEIDLDFGGTQLASLQLTTWAGEVDLDFSEPNEVLMSHLEINTKVGETNIRRLGNAHFEEAEINGGIGEMYIDLNGAFATSSRADIDLDIGSTTVDLPHNIGVKMQVSSFLFLSHWEAPSHLEKSGRYYYTGDYDNSPQRVELRISPGLGELQVN